MSRKTCYVPIIKEEVISGLNYMNMTQRDLALVLGVSYEHLNRCLSKGQISKTWLISIAKYLDISVGTLTGGNDYGLTYFAEERGKLLNNIDSVLIPLFHLLGRSEEQYRILKDWEISNLISNVDLLVYSALSNSVNAKKTWQEDEEIPF